MNAPEYVTEISVPSAGDRNGWRLCSGMSKPEPLPEPEAEAEAGTVTPAEAIEAAELIETEARYRNQVGRLMYEAGRHDAEAEMAQRWDRIARPAAHGKSYAELEERRWGPGGRAHFADPRPGDFPGVKKEAERERELEAGLCQTTRGCGARSPSRNRPRSSGSWIRGLRSRQP